MPAIRVHGELQQRRDALPISRRGTPARERVFERSERDGAAYDRWDDAHVGGEPGEQLDAAGPSRERGQREFGRDGGLGLERAGREEQNGVAVPQPAGDAP